ncbi:MAG: ATP-binding protein [Methanobrevibacter sp.]|uniref:ATP-binding protein n=1 Tax=Methanobrevibacter sp. TaxID=66852 RepID=UPI0026DFA644|nr:ATP-binding protein [Methanobrevibacter sp.]MDO5849273.1 ATP-binding protein [Methanobrevibacter sp.]
MLKFKKKEDKKIKTLIYGLDGTGKSTAAERYCKKKGLSPVVLDMDDTNHTELPILDLKITGPNMLVTAISNIITDICQSKDFDTLIIDGVGSLTDLLIPNDAKGQQAWLNRSQNFNKLWKCMRKSDINVIFIGQKDLIVTEENESSKISEKINNMVDWKFECKKKGNSFSNECTKWRGRKEEPI